MLIRLKKGSYISNVNNFSFTIDGAFSTDSGLKLLGVAGSIC